MSTTLEWPQIAEAGGIDAWVKRALAEQGLSFEHVDPARMSDAERKAYKARREEERRVRRALKKEAWAAYRRAHLVHLGAGIFFQDTPDVDRYDVEDPAARRRANELPELASALELARALGLTASRLRWLVFHREVDRATHYHRWRVPKRTGGERLISAPKPQLKAAQQWVRLNITEHLPVHGAAHGFLPGRSIASNAAVHAGAEVLVKMDLKDFYPSIGYRRVKGLFRKAGYGEQVATVLALLVTEAPRDEVELEGVRWFVATGERSLPQGAPTSPSITNALCFRLDTRLTGLSASLGFRYSRYADDLCFSWRPGSGPAHAPVGRLLRAARRVVSEEGFAPHPEKTRVMRCGRRQQVTGLVVNRVAAGPPARVPRETVRALKAALHHREHGRPGRGESLEQLRGLAAYVAMVDPARGRRFLERLDRLEVKSDEQLASPPDVQRG